MFIRHRLSFQIPINVPDMPGAPAFALSVTVKEWVLRPFDCLGQVLRRFCGRAGNTKLGDQAQKSMERTVDG